MITITNPKVRDLEPSWAPFKGFSLLFDNPGDSLQPYNRCPGTEVMSSRYDDEGSAFYTSLWKVSAADGSGLKERCGFCPLPLHSYHVTVWDGLNDFNANKFAEGDRLEALRFLRGLPQTLLSDSMFLNDGSGLPIGIQISPIEFVYAGLEKWNDSSVVVRLQPADPRSESALAHIQSERQRLNDYFAERFGIATANSSYKPHVSIGYFANKELGGTAAGAVAELDDALKSVMTGRILTFESISMYGMVDMETFFRKQP